MTTNIIIGIIVIAALLATYALAYFHGSKKANNINNVVKEIDTLSPLLAPVVSYIEGRLPEPARTEAKQITAGISDGITAAENGWKSGLLTAESRKDFALNATNATLLKLNIKPTDATSAIIAKAIDLAVALFLPISNTGAVPQNTAVPTAAAVQAEGAAQ